MYQPLGLNRSRLIVALGMINDGAMFIEPGLPNISPAPSGPAPLLYRCACGRVISANKNHCKACAETDSE